MFPVGISRLAEQFHFCLLDSAVRDQPRRSRYIVKAMKSGRDNRNKHHGLHIYSNGPTSRHRAFHGKCLVVSTILSPSQLKNALLVSRPPPPGHRPGPQRSHLSPILLRQNHQRHRPDARRFPARAGWALASAVPLIEHSLSRTLQRGVPTMPSVFIRGCSRFRYPCPSQFVRYRPPRAPVSLPSRMVAAPFTHIAEIPVQNWCGFS